MTRRVVREEGLFAGISTGAELLINKLESALSQDDIAKKRMADIKTGRIKGVSENVLDDYMKNRGVRID